MLNSEIQKLIRKVVVVADENRFQLEDVQKALADEFVHYESAKKNGVCEMATFRMQNVGLSNRIEGFVRNELYPLRERYPTFLLELSDVDFKFFETALMFYCMMTKKCMKVDLNEWICALADELKMPYKDAQNIMNTKMKKYICIYCGMGCYKKNMNVVMKFFYRAVMSTW